MNKLYIFLVLVLCVVLIGCKTTGKAILAADTCNGADMAGGARDNNGTCLDISEYGGCPDGMVDVGDMGVLSANYGKTNCSIGNLFCNGADFVGGARSSGGKCALTGLSTPTCPDGSVDVGELGVLSGNYGRTDCRSVIINQTHKICSGNSCITVQGAGTDQCQYNSQCIQNQTGSILVNSTPSQAGVFIDSAYKGETPITVSGISAGNHILNISKSMYETYITTVTVIRGQTSSVNAVLTSKQTTSSCTDSDGGMNYYVYGKAVVNTGGDSIDRCEGANTLIEAYCVSNSGPTNSISYTCPNGCLNGACINQTTGSCTDSDGRDYYIRGTSTLAQSHEDSCGTSSNSVDEFYCGGQSIQKNDYIFIAESGIDKRVRYRGYNYNLSIAKFDNVETGQRIEVPVTRGTTSTLNIFGALIQFIVLNFNSADSNIQLIGGPFLIQEAYVCTNGCLNGACINQTQIQTCTDSDGGINLLVRGEASGIHPDGDTYRWVDACSAQIGYDIVEEYCNGTEPAHYWSTCPAGYNCTDGACIKGQTTGSIKAGSQPTNASFYLDDVFKGLTTITVINIPVGEHKISIKKAGYNEYNNVTYVYVGQTTSVYAVLTPTATTGSIYAIPTPGPASVYVDNVYKGSAPILIPKVIPGKRQVKFTKTGYYDYVTTAEVFAGKTTNVYARLTPKPSTGNLYVSSKPASAYLYVDNIYRGLTPKTVTSLSVGTHAVKLTKTGYNPYTTSVYIKLLNTTSIEVTLTPITNTTPGNDTNLTR